MTWEEMLFRPIDADPFMYQGAAEREWERRELQKRGGLNPANMIEVSHDTTPSSQSIVDLTIYRDFPQTDAPPPDEDFDPTRCTTTTDHIKGMRRNLLAFPPFSCTTFDPDPTNYCKEIARLTNVYKQLKRRCFNKLVIHNPSSITIRAAIDAGWNLDDIVLSMSCCYMCKDIYEPVLPSGLLPYATRVGKEYYGCVNTYGESLEDLIIKAKRLIYCRDYGCPAGIEEDCPYNKRGPDGRQHDYQYEGKLNGFFTEEMYAKVPGFWNYYLDELDTDAGFPKSCDPPNDKCDSSKAKSFIDYASALDIKYNGGQVTPVTSGTWKATMDYVHEYPEMHGIALTGYSAKDWISEIRHAVGGADIRNQSGEIGELKSNFDEKYAYSPGTGELYLPFSYPWISADLDASWNETEYRGLLTAIRESGFVTAGYFAGLAFSPPPENLLLSLKAVFNGGHGPIQQIIDIIKSMVSYDRITLQRTVVELMKLGSPVNTQHVYDVFMNFAYIEIFRDMGCLEEILRGDKINIRDCLCEAFLAHVDTEFIPAAYAAGWIQFG